MSPVNHFGPAVIGQEAYEEQKLQAESLSNTFGPAVLGYPEPAAPVQTPAAPIDSEEAELLADRAKEPAAPAFNALSIPELEKELAKNPAEFDRLYRGEFARPEGPRKGALGVFLSAEQAKAAPREEVVAALFAMLRKPKETK